MPNSSFKALERSVPAHSSSYQRLCLSWLSHDTVVTQILRSARVFRDIKAHTTKHSPPCAYSTFYTTISSRHHLTGGKGWSSLGGEALSQLARTLILAHRVQYSTVEPLTSRRFIALGTQTLSARERRHSSRIPRAWQVNIGRSYS